MPKIYTAPQQIVFFSILSLSLLFIPSGIASAATTYYVSTTGDDTNSGTATTNAWKTLSRVNQVNLMPGDSVLLEGGSSFPGNLYLDSADIGNATSPITISSYNAGKATISAGSGDGISAYNTAGIAISNLTINGSGTTTNTGSGINLYADLPNGTTLSLVTIDMVDISNFGNSGILIGSWNQSTGYKDVTITNSKVHENAAGGITTYAEIPNVHKNVYIGHVTAYNNPGIPGLQKPSGSGIVLGGVDGGVIERSVAYSNGRLSDNVAGPVGIWAYDSTNVIIQSNESYKNWTSKADGDGFDLDQNTSNSIMQYNYSHDNAGAGFLMAQSPNNTKHTGNTIRYNISQNDVRKLPYGSISLYGKITNANIYNNTVYVTAVTGNAPRAIRIWNTSAVTNDVSNIRFNNNIIVARGGKELVRVDTDQLNGATNLSFTGNTYYTAGNVFAILWGANKYTTLSAWRTATKQETMNALPTGSIANPLLQGMGLAPTFGNADVLESMTNYKLALNSPALNTGLDLPTIFSLSVGMRDFYGTTIPAGTGYSVGAYDK